MLYQDKLHTDVTEITKRLYVGTIITTNVRAENLICRYWSHR